MKLKIALFLSVFLSFSALAQQEIETDRPGETENSFLVPKKMFQLETGLKHEQTAINEAEFLLPTILMKYGLSDYVEIRLLTELSYNKAQETQVYGLESLQIGTKIRILDEKNGFPALSFIGQLQIPKVESSAFETQHLAPEMRLVLRNTINSKLDIGYNAGIRWDGNSTQPEYFYTFAPNYKVTENMQVFIEGYGYFPVAHHSEQWIDTGFAISLSPNLQIDLSIGTELSNTAAYHNFFESVGVSFRI